MRACVCHFYSETDHVIFSTFMIYNSIPLYTFEVQYLIKDIDFGFN
jgi:hypothetical protein